jgi:hypothetical protein
MHPLHKAIGEFMGSARFKGCEIHLDTTLGGERSVPLYGTKARAQETKYCTVDALIMKAGRVKAIVDVDDAASSPTGIAGKFFATALSRYFIRKHKPEAPVPLDADCSYVLVLYAKDLSEKPSKLEQWRNFEEAVRESLPIPGSRIRHFRIFFGTSDDFLHGHGKDALLRYLEGRL